MKTNLSRNTNWLLTFLLLTLSLNLFSQKDITWKGGTPGKKNDWFCAQNWSTHSVPDEFSNVIIPDVTSSSLSSPIIPDGKVEINSLLIHSGGTLTVEKPAMLIVYDQAEGVFKPNFQGEGKIVIQIESSEALETMLAEKL